MRPGVVYTHRVDTPPETPQVIHILEIDLTHPSVSFETGLGGGTALSRETVPVQADRIPNRLAAINADFSGFVGSTEAPQNICIQDGELITTPNFRTAVGIDEFNRTRIGFWNSTEPPSFSWQGFVRDEQGNSHPVLQQNQDLNPGWMGVVTHRYRDPALSRGGEFDDEVEALLDVSGIVLSIHENGEGVVIPEGGMVLTGRTTAGVWINQNLSVGERVIYGRNTAPDWREHRTILGGGPRIVLDGQVYEDPIKAFSGGSVVENFTLEYKNTYYETRQPRTAIGVNEAGTKMYWVVVDGRQTGSAGMTLAELAGVLIGLGAHQATSMDGGGSSILYLDGEVKNSPSDGAPRRVTNSLILAYDEDAQPRRPPVNLALGKPTQTSSVFSEAFGGDRALDGVSSTASKWTSAQGIAPPHTLTVDLGRVEEIIGFRVRHAGESGESITFNTENFRIETADLEEGPWALTAEVENVTPDNVSRIDLSAAVTARYARLVVLDPGADSFARIAEFEVLGPAPSPPPFAVGLNSNQPIDTNTGAILYNSDPNLMADTGAEYVRLNFILGPWTSPDDPTKRGPDNLDWFETYDRMVDGYLEQGVEVYALVGNEAVRLPDGTTDPRTFTQSEAFTDLYEENWIAILDHFKDRVRVFESFNEPNDWAGGSAAQLPPDAFARNLARLYRATKGEEGRVDDPAWKDLTLVSGPLFTHNFDDGAGFWRQTFEAGIANHGWEEIREELGSYPYDGVGIHYYIKEGGEPPAETVAAIRASADAMMAVTDSFEGAGHGKRFYCSEFGFRDDYTGSRAATVGKMNALFDFFRSDGRYTQAHWFSLTDFPGAIYGLYEFGSPLLANRKNETWCAFRRNALGSGPIGMNRIEDGSFESGTLDHWATYGQTSGIRTSTQFGVGPTEGTKYFGLSRSGGGIPGGAYQTVPVQPGSRLSARAMISTYREGGEEKSTAARIGIDPTGGTDPEAESVIWSRLLESPSCAVPLAVEATAKSNRATVFLLHLQGGEGFNVVGFDEVTLTETKTSEPRHPISGFRVY